MESPLNTLVSWQHIFQVWILLVGQKHDWIERVVHVVAHQVRRDLRAAEVCEVKRNFL